MSDEQAPEWGPKEWGPKEWGAAQTRPPSQWTGRKTIAAVAIAVGITAAGGAAIYAASGSEAATGGGGPMGGPPGQDGGMLRGGPLADLPHGEFQTGEVTSVSDSALEVKSTDGYTKTYVVDAETVMEGVEQGDTVMVIATTTDGKATAETVTEPGNRGQRPDNATPPTR